MLPENTSINYHLSSLIDDKKPLYGLMYSPKLTELETLKTYIKIIQVSGFFGLLKFLAEALIHFDCEKNGSLCLFVDYPRHNNLMINNR